MFEVEDLELLLVLIIRVNVTAKDSIVKAVVFYI